MTSCYLCGSLDHRPRRGAVRDAVDIKILECVQCGLVFLTSSEHVGADHYARSGMHGEIPLDIVEWLRVTAGDDARRMTFLETAFSNQRLLDFGCGAGGFLLRAREQARLAHGVEVERRLHAHFQANGLMVHTGIDEAVASGQRYDVITAFHVIEHLTDPRRVIRQLADLLDENGRMIIEIPNSEDALLTLYDSEPFSRFTYWSQHLFLFNPRTLTDLVTQAGLKVEWVRQVQRYPLSNHLHWLARGLPGGHQAWPFLAGPVLDEAYAAQLAAIGRCDTILAEIRI